MANMGNRNYIQIAHLGYFFVCYLGNYLGNKCVPAHMEKEEKFCLSWQKKLFSIRPTIRAFGSYSNYYVL